MKRQDILNSFDVDTKGTIRTLGKFETEMLYVPYFYDQLMNGCADADVDNVAFFRVNADDLEQFPELDGVYGIALEESEQGFVYAATYDRSDEYDRAVEKIENSIAADENI